MIKIFIDFDGTITKQDVGDAMFEKFGGKQCLEFIKEYHQGLISATECFQRECSACNGTEQHTLNEFLDKQEIDSTFFDFQQFCNENKLEYIILSDGMDYYIQRILAKNGINNMPYFANHLELIPINGTREVRFIPAFQYTDEVCDRCACCKRNHMLTLCNDDDIIIYIGEGYSDRCPVQYADVVFAKDELLKYCQQENISYFEYQTFDDVRYRLKSMLMNKESKKINEFKKRRQAQLAAHDVFLGG